ncbi:hypothetical protein [Nocardia sp. NRRL S-836]|uniref:hypothetical protein n=1 Tax=Nocardia sp. NRRL S-836 TaxID=1519492 RepID=UPI0006C28C81|nr:hypothetical protein [Nocardia sp. NRRL S-836]KOV90049.1 hypothetical protein ADL03_01395 [Nocardia sp. NRRL S-836]
MSVDELGDALRYGPFHRALRVAIDRRGLSLSRLRAHLARLDLPVAESTLSYWQRGMRHPDGPRAFAVIRGLETVLGLAPDSLATLVGPREQPRRVTATTFVELSPLGPTTTELLASLLDDPGSCNAGVEVALTQERVVLGHRGQQQDVTTRIVLTARKPGVTRYLGIYHGDDNCDISTASVVGGDGCRIGRVRRADRSMVFELLFDRSLDQDETAVVSYTVNDGSGTPCPGYTRMFRDGAGPYLLQVAMTAQALPSRCSRVLGTREHQPPVEATELICDRALVASAYFPVTNRGVAGIALEWC